MLNRIIKFSLNNKLLVMLAVIVVVIGGTYSAKNITLKNVQCLNIAEKDAGIIYENCKYLKVENLTFEKK